MSESEKHIIQYIIKNQMDFTDFYITNSTTLINNYNLKRFKNIGYDWFYNYYIDSVTKSNIYHGLWNDYSCLKYGIGYKYHYQKKGLWLRNKYWL